MKARVKATGEIVEVVSVGNYINEFGTIVGEYQDACGILYISPELDFYIEEGIIIPDYWERLKHQAAISAMHGIMNNPIGFENIRARVLDKALSAEVAFLANEFATALVEKLKEEEKK